MRRNWATILLRWCFWTALAGAVAVGIGIIATRFLRPGVTVTTVVEGPVVQAFYATGTLLPQREYPVKANNPGIISTVLVDKGDRVKLGQPLATISEDAVQFRYDQAKAERDYKARLAEDQSPVLKEFDAKLQAFGELAQIAGREQDRMTVVMRNNAGTQADLDRAMDRVKTIWSEIEALKAQRATRKLELAKDLEVAEAALRTADFNRQRQTVVSPIDNGVVLDRPATVGTRVAVNDHLMQIADVRSENLVMRAAVDEEDITMVHLGQQVRMTLYAFADRVFEGKVAKIYDKADAERRTFEVDVAMVQPNAAFCAGMTGELAMIVDQKSKAMVVPSQAVQGGKLWVVEQGRLKQVAVTLGLKAVDRVEVLSGLQLDQQVVISPVDKLPDGQVVRTTYMDPIVAAGLNRPQSDQSSFKGFK